MQMQLVLSREMHLTHIRCVERRKRLNFSSQNFDRINISDKVLRVSFDMPWLWIVKRKSTLLVKFTNIITYTIHLKQARNVYRASTVINLNACLVSLTYLNLYSSHYQHSYRTAPQFTLLLLLLRYDYVSENVARCTPQSVLSLKYGKLP